ncbi:RhuM family protein [Pedobacter sp. Leaf216]|uniref:RhuM family protein n=1 Tax=Pedobacter sp. Leaf216 TaxID=1735684 RepID=UPI000701044F|nr:RhuM family protein [Pedobacter sp. Leaf216]
MHTANSDKPVAAFSLDVIISVGSRIKSREGTQFRIWANKILKEYLIKGYSINESQLKAQTEQLAGLKNTVNLISHVLVNKQLSSDEATGLLEVVTDYEYA